MGRDGVGLLVLLSLAFLISCGGGAGGGVTTGQAQTPTYSDANLSGTYNLEFAGSDSVSGLPVSGSGSFSASGSGQFTSGSYSISERGSLTCMGSLSGTYSISSTGSGTATLSAVPNASSASSGCPSRTLNFSLAASTDGNVAGFSEADDTQFAAGVAVK